MSGTCEVFEEITINSGILTAIIISYDYEACPNEREREGWRLQFNFGHLGFFNVQLNLKGISAFAPTEMRPKWLGSEPAQLQQRNTSPAKLPWRVTIKAVFSIATRRESAMEIDVAAKNIGQCIDLCAASVKHTHIFKHSHHSIKFNWKNYF